MCLCCRELEKGTVSAVWVDNFSKLLAVGVPRQSGFYKSFDWTVLGRVIVDRSEFLKSNISLKMSGANRAMPESLSRTRAVKTLLTSLHEEWADIERCLYNTSRTRRADRIPLIDPDYWGQLPRKTVFRPTEVRSTTVSSNKGLLTTLKALRDEFEDSEDVEFCMILGDVGVYTRLIKVRILIQNSCLSSSSGPTPTHLNSKT